MWLMLKIKGSSILHFSSSFHFGKHIPGTSNATWWNWRELILCRTTTTMSKGWDGGAPGQALTFKPHMSPTSFKYITSNLDTTHVKSHCHWKGEDKTNNRRALEKLFTHQTQTNPLQRRHCFRNKHQKTHCREETSVGPVGQSDSKRSGPVRTTSFPSVHSCHLVSRRIHSRTLTSMQND